MQSFIRVSRRWEDDDILQLEIEVCDGSSTVLTGAYERLEWFTTVADGLERFGKQIYGGLFDLQAGNFGPEYASGALDARFHKLYSHPCLSRYGEWRQSSLKS